MKNFMECRMTVYTPAGQAAGAAGKFKTVAHFTPSKLEVAEDGTSFTFTIEAPIKKMIKIQQRCQLFQTMAKQVLGQKVVGLVIRNDQKEQLNKFIDQTNIVMEVTKPATAEELADLTTGIWDRARKWFK